MESMTRTCECTPNSCDKRRLGKTRDDKGRQGKTREDKGRQGKTIQDNTRQHKTNTKTFQDGVRIVHVMAKVTVCLLHSIPIRNQKIKTNQKSENTKQSTKTRL
jgi:hypothetical protein